MKWVFIILFLANISSAADLPYFFLPTTASNVSSVTQDQAQNIAADLMRLYAQEVYQQTQMPISLQTDWQSPYFGAGVVKKEGYILVQALGGFVRAPGMNEDILAATFCHELGHILAGPPYQSIKGFEWTSVEGQADFFAASKCLPRYFQSKSTQIYQTAGLKNKIINAGLDLFLFAQKYSEDKTVVPVSLTASAPEKATTIRDAYPSDQCRLDTYKAGTQCLDSKVCKAPACWLPEQK